MMIDLTNQKFGRLTVLEKTTERKGSSVVWKCKCDCGNIHYTTTYFLKKGTVQSCGCLKSEKIAQVGKNKAFDLTNKKYGMLTAIKPTNKRLGNSVIWECRCDCGNTVFVRVAYLTRGITTSCGCLTKIIRKQNPKSNFYEYKKEYYIADTRLDCIGREKPYKNNKSGYTGVILRKRDGKWIAFITFQKKYYFLGAYGKIEDAVSVRKLAEEKLHGEFLEWYEKYKKQGKNNES